MLVTTIKDFTSNKYVKEFDSKVDAIERKVTPSIRKFYQDNYFKGVQNFLDTGATGYDNLFRVEDITKKYQQLYVDIGLHIANWYFRSFEKYHKKADPKPFTPKWTNAFSTYGSLIAAYNAPLVSGTAKTSLIKLTSRLMKDPDFMRLGEREKARILRKNFRQYSDYQARRLVRTESTRASNYAVEESSKTMFSEDQLSKQWVTMGDARVRNWHQSVNGQTRRMGEPFLVNGEEIMRPGEGSAKNTVNCRCRMITIPDEGAVPITEISDIGVGIGESRIPSFSLETITNTVVQTIATAGDALVEGVATTLNQFRTQIKETFEEVGLKINKLQLSTKRSLKEYNEIQSQIKSLMKKYNYATYHNDAEVQLMFRSGKRFIGYIKSSRLSGKTKVINLGSPFNTRNSRVRMHESNMIGKFDRRFNSHVDPDKDYLSTTVHEMAHLLTITNTAQKEFVLNLGTPGKRFWADLTKIRERYKTELITLREADNHVVFNDIFLGRYASTNADEFFAEAFTEYHLSSSPSKYAIEVGQLIEKYYGK
tara:strand:+ start:4265 stop:5878 length:1614 start_codon:yes stop_codon:yes gene_type:complete